MFLLQIYIVRSNANAPHDHDDFQVQVFADFMNIRSHDRRGQVRQLRQESGSLFNSMLEVFHFPKYNSDGILIIHVACLVTEYSS
jgi:hypothetical protein